MERTNTISIMLSALLLVGCDPTPESEAAPDHEALPPKTGAAPEHVKIVGYQLA
jgi:PBP1b-binding outer membrane lipoprotein LpoB